MAITVQGITPSPSDICNKTEEALACLELGVFFMLGDEEVSSETFEQAKENVNRIRMFWKSEIKTSISHELIYNGSFRNLAIRLDVNLGGAEKDLVTDLEPVVIRVKGVCRESLQYIEEGRRPDPDESAAIAQTFYALKDAIEASYRSSCGPRY